MKANGRIIQCQSQFQNQATVQSFQEMLVSVFGQAHELSSNSQSNINTKTILLYLCIK